MTYQEYMINHFVKESTREGDLARDIQMDTDFPELDGKDLDDDRRTVREYLELMGACDSCMAAFRYTWRRYREAMRKLM